MLKDYYPDPVFHGGNFAADTPVFRAVTIRTNIVAGQPDLGPGINWCMSWLRHVAYPAVKEIIVYPFKINIRAVIKSILTAITGSHVPRV